MAVKITLKSKNIREELTALSFAGVEKKKVYLNNLVNNGDFSNGTVGWTAVNSSISVVNGKLRITNSTAGTYGDASQLVPVVANKTYKINIETTDGTGDLYWIVSGQGVSSGYLNGSFTSSYTFTPTSSGNVQINARVTELGTANLPVDSGDYADIDNVSVVEIGDNMVVNGDFDYDGVWDKETGWTISGGTASCDGSQTNNVGFKQSRSDLKGELITGKQYTLTFTLSGHSGGGVQPHIRNLGYGTYITGDGTYTISLTGGTGNDGLNFYVQSDFVGSIDNVILTEGSHHVIQRLPKDLDVFRVFINGELAREGENYDYQIKTDGINQWLKPTVEPTATTETAVIGVYK